MIKKQLLLDARTATATSETIPVFRYLYKTFAFYGEGLTATAKVYGSYDDSNWIELGTLNDGDKLAVNESWVYARVVIESIAAGTAYAALMMRD